GLAAAPECVVGLVPSGALDGDLGTAPSGGVDLACLTLTNDRAFDRRVESAFSGVPIPRDTQLLDADLDRLVLVGPGNRRVPAQFDVLSRWGGPLDEATLPIRWLQVSTQAPVGADSATTVVLRLLSTPAADPADAFAATLTAVGDEYSVDTGVATFRIDPDAPELIRQIDIAPLDDGVSRQTAYLATPGAGPRLVFDPGTGPITLDTATPGAVTVDAGSFEIVEVGPVKVVVSVRGHFRAPSGESLCLALTPAYERFGYTAVATFHRGRRDVDLRFHVRNECSNGDLPPWRDETSVFAEASWRWPLAQTFVGTRTVFHAGSGALASSTAGFIGSTVVEQRKGAGDPWERRARVTRDGAALENAVALEKPIVAVSDGTFVAALQMPFLRFREPQALAVDGATLDARPVSETLVIGEGKAVWSTHRLSLRSVQQATTGQTLEAYLEELRDRGQAVLERGLLLHTDRTAWNASGLFGTIGDADTTSAFEDYYKETIDFIHQETTRPGGQWDRNKVYGSQLWPDIPFDLFSQAPSPDLHDAKGNYWNPLGAELWEFVHGGDPAFAWEFALPLAWTHAYANFLNLGDYGHGNRNGFVVAQGGVGEGQWNRNGNLSSDDHNYNMGMQLAYALRPDPAFRHRFDQAGRTAIDRYNLPQSQEAQRDFFVNAVDLQRGHIQRFEHLANCAEFSPGQRGRDCHARLIEIATELAQDNASAGVLCGGDVLNPGVPCSTPQVFMMASHFYYFFDRLYRNYGDLGGGLRRALVETPRALYDWALPRAGDGTSVDTAQVWPRGLDCTLSPDGSNLVSCVPWTGGEPTYLETYAQATALLLMAHQYDPNLGLCEIARAVLDDLAGLRSLDGYVGVGAGWFKGSSQAFQGLVHAVGGYEACVDP
ncbi:MAG: hypothetical protein AAGM22_33330, partial [Acidobacteriota bacterium]